MNKKIYAILIAFALLLAIPISAEAAKPIDQKFEQVNAYANFNSLIGDITTNTYVSVTQDVSGTYVYLSTFSYDNQWNFYSSGSGQEFISNNDAFSMDRKLSSASLTLPKMSIDIWTCDLATGECNYETKVLRNINVQWTGIGKTDSGIYKYKSGDGTYKYHSGASYITATAAGSIDSASLGISEYAEMGRYQVTQKIKQQK
jgi:hypothetical protein